MEPEIANATPLEIGYRLHELHVLNWGTFHHEIWTINPAGKSALLTGQNGSGKSTLVDALLTLLVHPQQRGYNLASTTSNRKRGERTVDSYVVGEYGRQRDEDDVSKPMRLRGDHTEPTVLVAVFRNETGQVVTLAHLYYFENDKLERFYIVASLPLRIEDHFQFDGNPAAFRKQMQALGGRVFRDFAPYASEFKARFGLVSDNALKLFNSIVSMKDIGKLTDFIRDFMLEPFDSRTRLDKLYKDFENLTTIYQGIVFDRRQLEQLEPITVDATRYQVLVNSLDDAKGARNTVPAYFADQRVKLLDQASAEIETEITSLQQQQDREERKLKDREATALELNLDLNKNDAHRQVQRLKDDIRRFEDELKEKQEYARQYDSLAKALGLPVYADQETFAQGQRQADELRAAIETKVASVNSQIAERHEQIGRVKNDIEDVASQIHALSKTKSSLLPYLTNFRADLADQLGIQRADLPFVGELVKVRDDAFEWEAAIEKLLRGFAQFMLVPQNLYGQAREHVDTTRIGGRLSYLVVRPTQQPVVPPRHADAVYHKLEFYPEAAREFLEFVQVSLSRQSGDYVCVDGPSDFDRYDKALTRHGQIKHSRERHEKDDKHFGDRGEYVLGWDNTAKKEALEVRHRKFQAKIQSLTGEVQGFEASQKSERTRLSQIDRLLSRDFNSIDWRSIVELIDIAQAEIETLEKTSDHLAALRERLSVVNAEIAALKGTIGQYNAHRGVLQQTREYYIKERAANDRRRHLHPDNPDSYVARIKRDMPNVDLTLDNIDEVQDDVIAKLDRRVEEREHDLDALKRSVQGRLNKFVGDFKPEGLDPHIEALPSFVALRRKIETDELPGQEQRYKAYMHSEMSRAIIDLTSNLEQAVQTYTDRIGALNVALEQIPYGERTCIQLSVDPISSTGEIGDFKARLLRAIPNQLDLQVESYAPIHDLLNDLKTRENWTQRVTDPRQWLEFSAQEVKDDGTFGEHHTDTSGKSGGQKAKLAYTVLASAIADQYGIFDTSGQARSAFRFVAIDEVFSKLDERNAHVAMSLFQTLGLQVLVVTPSDKIHVTEKYIGSIYIVQNPTGDQSRIVDMPIQEFRERYMNNPAVSIATLDGD